MSDERPPVRVIVERSLGEFLREASVLVRVFASMEPLLKGSPFRFSWIVSVFGVTIVLFLVGLYFMVRTE